MSSATQQNSHFFYLAPIRGITDALFRKVFHHHFPYFDAAVAPFINPQRTANFRARLMADVMPHNNSTLPLVPQLLNNGAKDFLGLGKRLEDLGYTNINWNLGCPAPMVARKKRGSGLLPYPDLIIELLEDVLPKLNAQVSIKTRLGYSDPEDIAALLPRLEEFPLKEIIIHPRIGTQLYKGEADPQNFGRCQELSSHQLVYNGDISSVADYRKLSARFPQTTRWMIGRGALANPFLVGEIRGIVVPGQERRDRLQKFHIDLYDRLKVRLSGDSHILGRMKQIWAYLIGSFPEKPKVLKKIKKASTEYKYLQAMAELFEGENV